MAPLTRSSTVRCREAFAEEQPHLVALPAHPCDAVATVERRVSRDGMVSVAGNLHSAPDRTRRRVLEVQSHPSEIRIFEDGALIASHPLLEGRKPRRVDPRHRSGPPPASRSGHRSRTATSAVDVIVAQRPLSFHDAAAQRMAGEEMAR